MEITHQTKIKDIYSAYKMFLFDEPDPDSENDADESDEFEEPADCKLVCQDTSVKFADFTEPILVKILTYLDSDFFYRLYRNKTVTQEYRGNNDNTVIRLSYIWLNQLMPAAYAATHENITVWSDSEGKERATQAELDSSQVMESFDNSNFQKACTEFNENWKKLRGLWKAEKLYPRPKLAFKPIFDLLSINIESKK